MKKLANRYTIVRCPNCPPMSLDNEQPLFLMAITKSGLQVECSNCGRDYEIRISDNGVVAYRDSLLAFDVVSVGGE